ncbi:MAG: DUF1178 family protein [Deltaproteobacteria bacterium]|nr:DUF1178 family protein [Deltaproteobacteria bacterium]
MVVYNLICKKNHKFEGWFPSFEGYKKQARNGQISCPVCGTSKVEKVPHACAVHVKREERTPEKSRPNPPEKPVPPVLTEAEAKEMLIRLHQYVRENFENVGPRFAEEARQIFHGEVEARPIHGTSTSEETQALDEEGVPYTILPKPELDS